MSRADLMAALQAGFDWVDAVPEDEYRRFDLDRDSSIGELNQALPKLELMFLAEDKTCWNTCCSSAIENKEVECSTVKECCDFICGFLEDWKVKYGK